MKIKTITCHDVYNAGASLQAFALQEYLMRKGHDVEIIDYKPEYLSRHYSLTTVNNPKYDKPILRELYILAKLGRRIQARKSPKKLAFDTFTNEYLHLTKKRYRTISDLKSDCPEADLYFAGSDQIWNPLFPNGKDPAFFLDFVSEKKKKASYAASFAVDELNEEDQARIREYLKTFGNISVREASAINILDKMGVSGTHVCDPVFLLYSKDWKKYVKAPENEKGYIFVYDFDSNKIIQEKVRGYAEKNDLFIVSAFPFEGGTYVNNMGPLEFLGTIVNADLVVSNSFHATAFSLIFHVPFLVFNRKESINARILDLLQYFETADVMIDINRQITKPEFNWEDIDEKMNRFACDSKNYINKCTEENE